MDKLNAYLCATIIDILADNDIRLIGNCMSVWTGDNSCMTSHKKYYWQ